MTTRPVTPPRRDRPRAPRPERKTPAERAIERLVELLEHSDPQVALSAAKLLLEQTPTHDPYPNIRKLRGGRIFRGGAEAIAGGPTP